MSAAVGWAGLAARPASLSAQPLDRPGTAFTGTVASADAFRLVLRADNGTLVTFPVDDPWTVPAGLVPGMRVTARYEVIDGSGYRLVGVKIASGPIEAGSTTDPPPMGPAPPSAPAGLRKQPGTSPVLRPPEAVAPTPEPTPESEVEEAAPPTVLAAAPVAEVARPAARAVAPQRAPLPRAEPPPGPREIVTLLTLLLVSSTLLWVAFARR